MKPACLNVCFLTNPIWRTPLPLGIAVLLTGLVSPNPNGLPSVVMKGSEYEILDSGGPSGSAGGRIVPIYHETHGLSSKQLRRIMESIFDHHAPQLQEILPVTLREQFRFPTIPEALRVLHVPDQHQSVPLLNQQATLEHQRLAFEELLLLQLALAMKRHRQVTAIPRYCFCQA